MNRYTYKAKRKDNGEWVYGSLIIERSTSMCLQEYRIPFIETYYIYTIEDGNNHYSKIEIKKETLCQCTGLQDIEGNYIFENDIVNIYFKKTNILNAIAEVIYKDYSFKLETPGYILADHNWEEDLKIIGNKFDEVKE